MCDLSWVPLVLSQELWPPVGWHPHPLGIYPDPPLGHLIGSGNMWYVGGSITAAGLVDGAAPGLVVVLLTVVEWCWSLSLLDMVVLGCTGGHVAVRVGELQASHHSSVAPSGHSRKPAKCVGNCGELPRSSQLRRTNCIWFCVGFLGEHATVDFCGDCECLAVCIRAVPSQIKLMSSPGDSCWHSCKWGQPEDWCSHSSVCWEHGRIGKGETCLERFLKGVWECTSLCVGPHCDRLWWSCCLPLLYECLHMDWEPSLMNPLMAVWCWWL